MAAESQHGPRAGAERWVRWLGMAAIAGCVAWQTWPWLGEPLLPFEDGAVLLPRHYARFDLLRCFDSYAGYIAFGSNLLAALCCLLPTTWIATAFVVAAAAATVAAASAMLHPAWRRLLPPAAQLGGALVLAMPIGSYLMLTSLGYAQWALLWWLLICMLHPARRQGIARAGESLLVAALAWSHPLAVLIVPLSAVPSLRRVDPLRWLVLGVAVAGYWVLGLSREPLDLQPIPGGGAAAAIELLMGAGAVQAVIGAAGRAWLQVHCGAWCVFVAGGVVLGGLAWGSSRALRSVDRALRVRVVAVAWFAVAVVVASAFSRRAAGGGAGWFVRYVWLLRVAVLLIAAWAAGTRWRGRLAGTAVLVVQLLLAALLWRSNRDYYVHSAGAERIRMLGDELAAQEERRGGRAQVEVAVPRDPPILIRPR